MTIRISKKSRLIIVILIVAVVAIVAIALSRNSSDPSDLTLPIIAWDETTLSTLAGTPVVLNFWATWCGPCRMELPYLEAVAQQSEGQMKIIAINVGESASTVQKFFGEYEPTMILASDSHGEAFADYSQAYNNTRRAIPLTLFVDSEGVVQHVRIGAFTSQEELQNTLDSVF